MELLEYWTIIRKRLWLIILLMLIAGSAAFYLKQQQVLQYRTTTTLFLNPGAGATLPFQSAVTIQSLANTYSEYMRTMSFARLVREQLGRAVSDKDVLDAVTTSYVNNTQFFRISAVHPEPELAQRLANTAAEVLIAENIVRQQAQQQQVDVQRDPAKLAEQQQLTSLQLALQEELLGYDEQIDALRAEIVDRQAQPDAAGVDEQLQALRTELRGVQSLRIDVLSSLSQTQATLATSGSNAPTVDTAVVVDVAPLPGMPLGRGTLSSLLLAIIAAGAAGVGIALLLEYIDFTIKTPEALDAIYGASALGVIGVVTGKRGEAEKGHPLVALRDPFSPTAEAFRALRTSLQAASQERPIRSLLITSAGPGEGKSFVAGNLAISLAKNGARVILVDSDLRKPTLHIDFGLKREPGFTDLILDQHLDPVIALQPTSVDQLWVLPCGTVPNNPAEMLGSPRAAQVMRELAEQADIVVYDTPPAATVTDAVVLASRVDAVLHVVGAGTTRINLVLRCKALLEQAGVPTLGPVLNRVKVSDLGYYANYYYGYYRNDERPHKRSAWQTLFARRPKPEEPRVEAKS